MSSERLKQDQPFPAGDQIISVIGGVRNDSSTSKATSDGNVAPLKVTSDGGLSVSVTSGGGGTEYTEGDIDTTITGHAALMEDSNTLRPLQGNSTDGLLVNLGANNDITVTSVPAPLSTTGGGTEAASLRVTLANDSSGLVSVDDNGGSLTVDGTVAATQSGTWDINNVSGTISLPTGAATSANQTTQITSLQLLDDVVFAEDSGHASGDKGTFILGVNRQGTPGGALTDTNNDYSPIALNQQGGVYADINIGNQGSAANGILKAKDSVAGATDAGIMVFSIREDSLTTLSPSVGDYAHLKCNDVGAIYGTTIASKTGGESVYSAIGAASENATVVASVSSKLYIIELTNINIAPVYFKVYDKSTGPTSADTPVLRIGIPGSASGGKAFLEFPNGLQFTNGISYRMVAGITDASTTATSADEQLINLSYKS